MPIVINKKLDCRAFYDPLPIFKLKDTLCAMKKGEVLEFLGDEAKFTVLDIQAWCKLTGHKWIESFVNGNIYSIYIEKI